MAPMQAHQSRKYKLRSWEKRFSTTGTPVVENKSLILEKMVKKVSTIFGIIQLKDYEIFNL